MHSKTVLASLLPALVAAQAQAGQQPQQPARQVDIGINPNTDTTFDPNTSQGTLGPFQIPQAPSTAATGGPQPPLDARTVQAMQLAISNWQTDTGIVSLFQNNGPITQDNDQFKGIADGAFKAEVDELSQKAVLDQVIGNDPRVSLANLTLTNGVFQSVVDNLQIMSLQGTQRANLVDTINQVRCTQILPSIDTYMLVAAEYIGDNAQQRRAVRPNACAGILAASNATAFAALPGTPGGTPPGIGDGIVGNVPGACQQGSGLAPNTTMNNGNQNAGVPAPPPLTNITTPQLGLPGFVPTSSASPSASASPSSSGTPNQSQFTPVASPPPGPNRPQLPPCPPGFAYPPGFGGRPGPKMRTFCIPRGPPPPRPQGQPGQGSAPQQGQGQTQSGQQGRY